MTIGSVNNTSIKFQGAEPQILSSNDEFLKLIAQNQAFRTDTSLSQPDTDTLDTSNEQKPKKKGGFLRKCFGVLFLTAGIATIATAGTALYKTNGKSQEACDKIGNWAKQAWGSVKNNWNKMTGKAEAS